MNLQTASRLGNLAICLYLCHHRTAPALATCPRRPKM